LATDREANPGNPSATNSGQEQFTPTGEPVNPVSEAKAGARLED